ncbi:hypothetical protein TD95_003039 [Thielaviopsis punctulata]|uniref:Mediator of RNA polymerase II transcription subunit 4 n=1 Tax=Thielaviopsis punctulata TaxID=72032 RepID=A0A0F4ZEU0_9PEZI|nr:hypothetical protein TD95_003039 [Thielaviopsis punctulata]
MDKQIDAHFQRVELALSSLIDSIAKYHPTIAHARELQQADQALTLGLQEVQTHQANFLRLQKLRAASASLDSQIRDTIVSLATTRKDVATVQTVKFPDAPAHPFTYEELLSYARRISKTTLPPPPPPSANPPAPDLLVQNSAVGTTPNTPGADSVPGSSAPTPAALPTPTQSHMPGDALPAAAAGASFTELPENLALHLNPMAQTVFIPWPLEDRIRLGALATTQMLINDGIDPIGYDPVAEEERKKKEEEERLAREEAERREREERDRALREQREKMREQELRESYRRESGMPAGQSSPVEKKQFHFTSLDMDDDDDSD